jgi:hypothetical protein
VRNQEKKKDKSGCPNNVDARGEGRIKKEKGECGSYVWKQLDGGEKKKQKKRVLMTTGRGAL